MMSLLGITGFSLWRTSSALTPTPLQAEGPFYPVTPIPMRHSLILDPAVEGEVMQLHGQVMSTQGEPLPGVKIEIWQCDSAGYYDHPRQANHYRFDPYFAGCGAVVSDANGHYQLTTLVPVPYLNRPPHIHVKLWRDEQLLLISQLYLTVDHAHQQTLQITPVKTGTHSTALFDFVVAEPTA